MKTQTHPDRSFEFYVADLDTLLLVENCPDEVLIRATRNTFSQRRKLHFIQMLSHEGFIPDFCRWVSNLDTSWFPIRWIIDTSWVRIPEAVVARARRFMVRLLASAAVLLAGLMAALSFI